MPLNVTARQAAAYAAQAKGEPVPEQPLAAVPAEDFQAVYEFRKDSAERRPDGQPCWHKPLFCRRTGMVYCERGC